MAQERPRYDGFLPGQEQIDGYGAGGFTFAGLSHRGSLLALPKGMVAWKGVAGFSDVTAQTLAGVLAEPGGSIDILLLGTGRSLQPIPRELRALLLERGIRCDPMATGHAVATYNILLGERRKVAAALVATP